MLLEMTSRLTHKITGHGGLWIGSPNLGVLLANRRSYRGHLFSIKNAPTVITNGDMPEVTL